MRKLQYEDTTKIILNNAERLELLETLEEMETKCKRYDMIAELLEKIKEDKEINIIRRMGVFIQITNEIIKGELD